MDPLQKAFEHLAEVSKYLNWIPPRADLAKLEVRYAVDSLNQLRNREAAVRPSLPGNPPSETADDIPMHPGARTIRRYKKTDS